jgi:hypothetical protein
MATVPRRRQGTNGRQNTSTIFMTSTEICISILALLFPGFDYVLNWTKMGWATFWAIFFHERIGSPCSTLRPFLLLYCKI